MTQGSSGAFRDIATTKRASLAERYTLNPERCVKARPPVRMPPTEVAINPITIEDIAEGAVDCVNVPTLHSAAYQQNAE